MKKLFALSVMVFILLNILSLYANGEREEIAKNVLRLHVVGESNKEKDQALKIKVRDALLTSFGEGLSKAETREEAIRLAEAKKEEMIKVAEKTLKENGSNSKVTIEIGKCRFPLKVYGNIRLPEGEYYALNVKIGRAEGENWWCVMYPPLCFSSCTEGNLEDEGIKTLKENLGEKRFSLISDDTKEIKIKFKILEIFG